MTEEEVAQALADHLNDDAGPDEELGTIMAAGVHVHIRLGPALGPAAGEEFTLLVIKERA